MSVVRWPTSVRARLTIWYTIALGVPLIAFAAASFLVLGRTLVARTDRFMNDALTSFISELFAEQHEMPTTMSAILASLAEMQFNDLQIIMLDSTNAHVASLPTVPAAFRGQTPSLPAGHVDHPPGPDQAVPVDYREMLDSLRRYPRTEESVLVLKDRDGGYRVHARPATVNGIPFRLVGAYPMHATRETLNLIGGAYLVSIPLLLASAAAGASFLVKRSLSPVASMAARAAEISATNLHERLPVAESHDELSELATVINRLLVRLDDAFTHQRRFMADASHELRTPVAILRTEADVTLARDHREEREYRDSVVVMRDASHRLSRIVDDLFLLARADAGHLVVRHDEVYLDEIVHDAVRAVRGLADQRGVQLHLAPLVDAPMLGDADLLGRLLLNLLDNAIKFSPPNATVELELTRRGDMHEIRVIDSGPGIAADVQSRVFERFFRVDEARSRAQATETSGAGLGLAIARWIAEAHDGELDLVGSTPGRTEFRMRLPNSENGTTGQGARRTRA